MNKRKLDTNELIDIEPISNNDLSRYKLYTDYFNPQTGDKITLVDNHIYFNAIINQASISTLIQYINLVVLNFKLFNNSDFIYLHINSKGGYIKYLLEFIQFKKSCSISMTSIIDKECVDSGLLLAALCNYRIIHKNAECFLTGLTNGNNCYWNYFKQNNDDDSEIYGFKKIIYYILCEVIDSKITTDKLDKYFQKNNTWDAKKYKKLGLADEII